ncbi:MAG: hypothetical protein WCF33_04080 [Pseudonocardiaceae bacterium]|jgi:hypothetical protein
MLTDNNAASSGLSSGMAPELRARMVSHEVAQTPVALAREV